MEASASIVVATAWRSTWTTSTSAPVLTAHRSMPQEGAGSGVLTVAGGDGADTDGAGTCGAAVGRWRGAHEASARTARMRPMCRFRAMRDAYAEVRRRLYHDRPRRSFQSGHSEFSNGSLQDARLVFGRRRRADVPSRYHPLRRALVARWSMARVTYHRRQNARVVSLPKLTPALGGRWTSSSLCSCQLNTQSRPARNRIARIRGSTIPESRRDEIPEIRSVVFMVLVLR